MGEHKDPDQDLEPKARTASTVYAAVYCLLQYNHFLGGCLHETKHKHRYEHELELE